MKSARLENRAASGNSKSNNMLSFLFQRPVAVCMSFLAALIFSYLAIQQLPISLLPSIDVPQIIIKLDVPNRSPVEIEQNFLRPIRESLSALSGIEAIESQANSQSGQVILRFAFGKNMNLAYIESNEKIDQLSASFPKDLPRPQVVRVNTSDIPLMRLQILPKQANSDWVMLSELVEKVIKKRLERLKGVSLIDANGLQKRNLIITPDMLQLKSLNISIDQLIERIQSQNLELGALSVKDGQYRYYVKLGNRLNSPEDLQKLYLSNEQGDRIALAKVAQIRDTIARPQGFHLYNTQNALVLSIQKQAQAKTTALVPLLYETVAQLKEEYPQLAFHLTQDQSLLLRLSIENLQSSLLLGTVLAFVILFVFMGNYSIPVMMGISLPVSLMVSFLVFYVFGLSINIISLSGLALGLGMLIDNAIIVLDNISRKRAEGLALLESCVEGTSERIAPLVSSVLTTLAVFVPLVFLNGLSGALFYDQAVAIAATLGASLVVSFLLLPVLYRLFYFRKIGIPNSDSWFFERLLAAYQYLEYYFFEYKIWAFGLFGGLLMIAFFLLYQIKISNLPDLQKRESQLIVFWNEPISVFENQARTRQLIKTHQDLHLSSESEVGFSQFLRQEGQNLLQKTEIYFACKSSTQKIQLQNALQAYLRQQYPQASFELRDALNAFDQLFQSKKALLSLKWKSIQAHQPLAIEKIRPYARALAEKLAPYQPSLEAGLQLATSLNLQLDAAALQRYQIPAKTVLNSLEQLFGTLNITELKNFGDIIPIYLQSPDTDFKQKINTHYIFNQNGQSYPLALFVKLEFQEDYQAYTADKTGVFHSLALAQVPPNWESLAQQLRQEALSQGMTLELEGTYYETRESLLQLGIILLIAVLLLYFILAAQFESFWQPLLVILTLPMGLAGALIFLWTGGNTLNIMSAIGAVVMLGIIVNDTILKIDNINRFRRSMPLLEALHRAGRISFKPILMTSLTTILALVPILWGSGLGAQLQKPLVLAVMGGLSIGTFTAVYFVPLLYWALARGKAS
ncbi:MAG: efflux RND transporter permease subunit [Microscillaceae bacterium]|nr:efflux RND transporter permease subunit [Microscillaceae bacterium]